MPAEAHRRLAAIDLGTVTMRLLIADVTAHSIAEVERSTDIVHLGEGLTGSGALSAAAIERVRQVAARYAQAIASAGVERVRAIATSASRDASNGESLLSAVGETGITLEIIGGDEEAALSFAGATWGAGYARVLLNDIGGGSTELVLGRPAATDAEGGRGRIERARSIDVGSRRITETFLHSDPPTPGELARAREWVLGELGTFFEPRFEPPDTLVSVAGTATSLSAIKQGLAVYDPARVHGSRITRADVASMLATLSGLTVAERREVVGLHPGRAPVIVAGALVLDCILELAQTAETTVSEHDILYGTLLSM